MTTRYRVEYALKAHRRDHFIEWIKGLVAVPFVLLSHPTAGFESRAGGVMKIAEEAHTKYVDIFREIEQMIDDHIKHQDIGIQHQSKLKLLVPSIGTFFTRLPLVEAFKIQDRIRSISYRRFVPPSFNDIRLILNTAQTLAITMTGSLELATFDGDVTLYDDGQSLEPTNDVIPRILALMALNIKIGIVTAAGYLESEKYYSRLHGLLEAAVASEVLTMKQKQNLIVMGGESNYLFKFSPTAPHLLERIPRQQWLLPEMTTWTESRIQLLLGRAELALSECIESLHLPAIVLRKERAVGIIPASPTIKLPRESLEEIVLAVSKVLEASPPNPPPSLINGSATTYANANSNNADKIPFCVFNGGNDVFVDIGDKSWGVRCVQKYFSDQDNECGRPIYPYRTIHVGDQFLSSNGTNDFRARTVATTAWVASPAETVVLLDEIMGIVAAMRSGNERRGESKFELLN
ncbi:hypothetical protein G7Y89_g4071 [Cudoniella acicularis]|uniref:IMP-specific 5'-nucleotidase 1 n=1 Tax=Cudoniella acicularis TaxID=354080 RepID=A0A8H4W725_9HELO|nr:hypothetical protein G7Y89_g4071 [Cudoniella acicularis]